MATVAGVDLGFQRENVSAGVALRLSDEAVEGASVRTAPDELVEVHPEARVALVLLEASSDQIVVSAHEAAQRALDIVAFTGRGAATLPRAHDECVLWWRDGNEIHLRVAVTKEVGVTMRATGTVTGPDGDVVEQPAPPEPEWTPALRFFRQSQVADDVFEAYRNAFLALESILSTLVTDGPGGERAWLEHALREVDGRGVVDIAIYVKTAREDAVATFLAEQYEAMRCATFHAKAHRPPVILPGSLVEREQVGDALEPLTRLVIDLAKDVVKASYRSGAMTAAGFEGLFVAPKVGNLELTLARHEAEQRVGEVALDCGYVGRIDDGGFEHGFVGTAAVSEIAGHSFDALIAVSPEEGGLTFPLDVTLPILPVNAEGATRFDVLLAFALKNLRLPKRRFSL